MAKRKPKVEWLGQPGHFICAARCVFHLHTHVGRFCVSTVGEFYPEMNRRGNEMGEMDRLDPHDPNVRPKFYETAVHFLQANGETGELIDMTRWETREEAAREHRRIVERYVALGPKAVVRVLAPAPSRP